MSSPRSQVQGIGTLAPKRLVQVGLPAGPLALSQFVPNVLSQVPSPRNWDMDFRTFGPRWSKWASQLIHCPKSLSQFVPGIGTLANKRMAPLGPRGQVTSPELSHVLSSLIPCHVPSLVPTCGQACWSTGPVPVCPQCLVPGPKSKSQVHVGKPADPMSQVPVPICPSHWDIGFQTFGPTWSKWTSHWPRIVPLSCPV